MSPYHLSLLGLAALGTCACLVTGSRRQRVEALLALAAMGVAMTCGLVGLVLGAGVLVAIAPGALRGAAPALCAHRAASHLTMAGVLVALFVLNGAGLCGAAAIPLVTPAGITRLLLPALAESYLILTVLALAAYAAFAGALCLRAALCRQRALLWEVAPMTLATLGMGVGLN
ncbi:hypothetical protein [Pseudooceanicola algae]|uniref:Uncharacterized protein n=1 Tax=Pseudooceanicola algae TaxID=1537215 RepID=A0A418SHN5_9RHOB|nr:hypothetical protein [Pseudooceanicola algae]QPM90278.1 hypothetical protein PSAL_015130 [Pseudooceanicola algae]